MANPYHDEHGKFCSKGEMQAAIQGLAAKSDLEGYFKLRTELEAIEAKKVVVSEEFIHRIARSGLNIFSSNLSTEDISEIYKSISPNLSTSAGKEVYSVLGLVNNPNTPANIRDDILDRASMEVKYGIAEKGIYESSPMLGVDLQKLVAGENDDKLVDLIMRTEKLTFEDKYNISKQTPHGLAYLATHNPQTFFSVPELEKEMRVKTESLDVTDSDARYAYFRVMARYSKLQESHNTVLAKAPSASEEHFNKDPLRSLAENKNITAVTGLKIAKRYVRENITGWEIVNRSLAHNEQGVAGSIFRRASQHAENANISTIKTEVLASDKKELARVTSLKEEIRSRELTYAEQADIATVEARVNGYEENYKGLIHRQKLLRRRNAPEINEQNETWGTLEQKRSEAIAVLRGKAYIAGLDAMILNNRYI